MHALRRIAVIQEWGWRMSRYWSRLSILAFLGLLYASPLSSGDKGLWLSVTSMPVPLFGAVPGGVPPEHSILLPDRGGLSLAQARGECGDPASGAGLVAVDDAPIDATWTTVSQPPYRATRDAIFRAPSVPRGPPA